MKAFLVFVLCGITYCLAVPTCSEDEIRKCDESWDEPPTSDEDALISGCRRSNCILEIADRCGVSILEKYYGKYFPIKGYRKSVNTICDKTNPMRKKYLELVKCKREKFGPDNSIEEACGMTICEDCDRENFCKKLLPWMECAVKFVTDVCGQEAGFVLRETASGSVIDPYDCLL